MASHKKSLSKKDIRNIIIIVLACVLIISVLSVILYQRKKENDRTVKVAFCGLSQEITELIKNEIHESEEMKLAYFELNKDDIDLGAVSEKFDMIFTWEGEITEKLGKFSEDIPLKINQSIPSSLRNKENYTILLDHYEMAFYKPLKEKYNLKYPQKWNDFVAYLKEASNHVFTPFFCQGSNDRTLLALIGLVVEARGGEAAYKNLIELLNTNDNLLEIYDQTLCTVEEGPLTIHSILDMFKLWTEQGLLHPLWYNASYNDVIYFMTDNQIAVLFDSLTEHRNVAYSLIRDYDSLRAPCDLSPNEHGVIAPAIVCTLLSNNMNNDDVLRNFATEEVQTRLSSASRLAPSHSRAEAYDRQADDVRFYAASCKGGPLPDLALALYQRNPEGLKKLASEIRDYLKAK